MPDRWTDGIRRERDRQLLAMPGNGYEKVGLGVRWVCPYCRERFQVKDLWPHLDSVHGVYYDSTPHHAGWHRRTVS